ncbi:MAG TPA: ABC transporter substrate-binding protein, partial [Rhodopila sp.]|nr:ABC transporter substrate-binding protein [Rhodopila sp.]
MNLSRRFVLTSTAAAATLPLARRARAQTPTIKIGVLNDQSGPYTNTGGLTSVVCAKQAAEDLKAAGKIQGFNVDVVTA